MSVFAHVERAPRDPILGLNDAYNADTRAGKVNLGVGVYTDAEGRVPLLRAVAEAEHRLQRSRRPRSYLPIDGMPDYDARVQALLFGVEAAPVTQGRVVTAQALGGTGALRIGADLLHRAAPQATVAISDPTWANHRGVFESAGFEVVTYPYLDAARNALDIDGMLAGLATLPAGSIVVLHACCHNPTGVDPTAGQWQRIVDTLRERGLFPFVDMAYQGFAEGLEADAYALRLLADSGLAMCVAQSFSKSFSLYGERVGALSVVTANADEAERARSQLRQLIRSNYSNPPTHGAALVATVLESDELGAMWREELEGMRQRILHMREGLVQRLQAAGAQGDFGFIRRQCGMFSFSGLSRGQVERLREEYAIYAVGSGRICVAALNEGNIDHVARAIAAVSR